MVPLELTSSTTASFGYLNTNQQQKNNVKSNLMMMIRAYKKQINEPHKDVQEHKTGGRNA